MRLGLGSYSYRWAIGTETFRPENPARLADLVRDAGDLRVDVLQVADSQELEEADTAALRRLREQADAVGVQWQIGFTEATPDRLDLFLHAAEILGADVVRVVLHDNAPDSAEVAALARIAPRYEAAGVTLGIENHFTITSVRLAQLIGQLDSPAVRAVLDVGNSIVCGEWPEETIRVLAPYAVCIHLKDYTIVPDVDGVGGHLIGTPLGSGRTDRATIVELLKALDPAIAVVVEQWSPRCETVSATLALEREWRETSVTAAREWLREASTS